jgi:hypothetical protein
MPAGEICVACASSRQRALLAASSSPIQRSCALPNIERPGAESSSQPSSARPPARPGGLHGGGERYWRLSSVQRSASCPHRWRAWISIDGPAGAIDGATGRCSKYAL